MYFNRILVTGFVLVFSSSSIFAAKTTTGKPSQSTLAIKPTTPAIKATAAKNTTTKDGISLRLDQSAPNATRKGASPGKIINTRFGSSGNVEEQCQCTLFYLCEQSSIVEGSGIECSDSSFVCCKIPTVIDTIPITPDVNVPPTDLSQQTCVCVPFYQCADYDPLSSTAGAEVINYKFPCKPPDFCCSPDKVISGGGAENPPPIPEKITPKPPTSGSDQSCVCVSSNQCSNYDPSAPTYGEGIIDLKFPCEKPDICCPHEKLIPGAGGQIPPKIPEIPPIPPTSTSQSTCVCVPSNQCSITQTFGEGLINYKFPCQNPDICCPHENVIPGPPYTPEPSPTPSPQPPNIPPGGTPHVDECGIRKATQNKISAPEHLAQTSFGEFPWMALILATEISPSGVKNENVFVCGASLLSPSIVLTAAHCIAHLNPSLLRVRVGEYNTREGLTEPLIHQDRAVSRIVIHNNFNNRTAFNDLALIKVTEDFNFASHISPICTGFTNSIYADPNSYNPSECLATGWGKNAFNQGEFQTTLKRVDLTLIPRDECQSRLRQTKLGQYFLLHESFICAGGQPGFDTCQGDGGGPLVCVTRDNPDRYIQVGVVSWGIGCATDIPGVYASLEANRDWLIAEYNTMNLFSRGKFQ